MNKEVSVKLLKDIHEYYECSAEFNTDGSVVENRKDESKPIKHKSVVDALKSWVKTMESTNKSCFETGDVGRYNTWSKEQLNFIKGLQ